MSNLFENLFRGGGIEARAAKQKEKVEQHTRANLEHMSEDLVFGAHKAYEMSAVGRTERMAGISALAGRRSFFETYGSDPLFSQVKAQDLEHLLYSAGAESAQLYERFFDEEGEPIQSLKEEYEGAGSLIASINQTYFNRLGALIPGGMTGDEIQEKINTIDFRDIIALVSRQLGRAEPPVRDEAEIKKMLADTVGNDRFVGEINNLPIGAPGARTALSDKETLALDLALRLANTTWMATQAHRAVWEGNEKRINPKERDVFDVYDLLKRRKFETVRAASGEEAALYRVAFELWKDMLQLRAK